MFNLSYRWDYFSLRLILISTFILIMVFSCAITTSAAPYLDDPTKIVVFFSHNTINSGSSGDQSYDSFSGTFCGVGIPTTFGNVGINTTTNTSEGYFEIFTNFLYNEVFMDISLNHMGDNGTVVRYCAYRPFEIETGNYQRINTVFGPGLSILSTDKATTFSILLQAKANYYFMEGCFAYGSVMYDFMYNSGNIEAGFGFSY